MAKRPFYFNPDTNIGTFDPPFKRLRVHDASNDIGTACGCSDVTPQVERAAGESTACTPRPTALAAPAVAHATLENSSAFPTNSYDDACKDRGDQECRILSTMREGEKEQEHVSDSEDEGNRADRGKQEFEAVVVID